MIVTACDTFLTYTNERQMSLIMAPFSEYWLEKVQEDLKNNIFSEAQTGLDGKIFVTDNLDERRLVLTGFLNENNWQPMKRALERTFNPTLGGTLTYTNIAQGVTRTIECRVEAVPSIYWSRGEPRFDIQLVCSDPFWRGQERMEIIALLQKAFHFEVAIPASGMYFGLRRRTLQTEFENVGDVASGFRVVFKATAGGTVVNPLVKDMVTGDFIKVNYTLHPNETLEVINFPQQKRIILNGTENAFRYLDVGSVFFELPVGQNLIGYDSDENVSNLNVTIYYIPFYLGV